MGKNKNNKAHQHQHQNCKGKTKKGGPCPNPPEKGGFCGHHANQKNSNNKPKHQNGNFKQNQFENPKKQQSFFAGKQQEHVEDLFVAVNKTKDRRKRLNEFMARYGISGSSRLEIVKTLVDCPISYLRRMINENHLSVDINQSDKNQIAIDIVTHIELPDLENNMFAEYRLRALLVKHQFERLADTFKLAISQSHPELQKFILSNAMNWCACSSGNSGHMPLVSSFQVDQLGLNQLGRLFSGFESLFKLDWIPNAANAYEITIWLSNYISKSEWESFFTFTLGECKEALIRFSMNDSWQAMPSKRTKENHENVLGFGWNLF
jgi:hypothetical protein